MGNGNDDYQDPVSPTRRAPVPPEVFPDQLAEQQAPEQGGDEEQGDQFDQLKGDALDDAVREHNESASEEDKILLSATADEKRDALRKAAASG